MASRFFPLYNIDQPVGPRKPNKADDVRLIRNLFIEVSRYDAAIWIPLIPVELRNLTNVGGFDDQLEQWILAFQRYNKSHYGSDNFVVDGVIDPMPVQSITVSVNFKSGCISTLAFLCNRLWRFNRDAYLRIGDADRLPWIPAGWVN